MKGRYEIRLAGTGGQGLVLAGRLLAEAAVLYDGKNALQTASYGAEQRGGPSRSEIIISDEEIDYPRVLEADLLLALSQSAFDAYHSAVKKGGIVLVDSSQIEKLPDKVCALPFTRIAEETTKREMAAAIVALGAISSLTGIVSREAMRAAVAARAPAGSKEANLRALKAGFEAGETLRVSSYREGEHGL